jgi:hypothetical protein
MTTNRQRGWLFGIIALVATIAQVVVAVAPLAEGRDGRFASHVESTGTRGHLAHNDATCASCQARSIHGTISRESAPSLPDAKARTAFVATATWMVATAFRSQESPRAPPRVI